MSDQQPRGSTRVVEDGASWELDVFDGEAWQPCAGGPAPAPEDIEERERDTIRAVLGET